MDPIRFPAGESIELTSFPGTPSTAPSKAQQIFEQVKPKTEYNPDGKVHRWAFFRGMDWLGHQLTTPASLFLDSVVRWKVLDFNPGAKDQGKTVEEENGYRASARNKAILLALPALIGGIIGGGLRLIANFFDRKDFVYHQVDPKNQAAPKTDKDISVLSMNVLFMPDFISKRNHQTAPLERAEAIANKIIENNSDFVLLQEAFHSEAAEVLDKKLHAVGFNVVRNIGDHSWGLGSGLMLASKHKLEDVQFFQHPGLSAGMDSWAHKGVVLAHAEVNGKRVVIANTHLNGGGDIFKPFNLFEYIKNGFKRTLLSEAPAASRAAQILALQTHINKYAADLEAQGKGPIDGVILAGDTNVSPTFYEGRDVQGKLKPIIKSEWYLTDEIQKRLEELPIPNVEDLDDTMAWKAFVEKVDEIIAEHDLEYNSSRIQWIMNRAEELSNKPYFDMNEWEIFHQQAKKLWSSLQKAQDPNLQQIKDLIYGFSVMTFVSPQSLKKIVKDLKEAHRINKEQADKFDHANVKRIVDEQARRGVGGIFPKEYEHDVHDGDRGLGGTTLNLEGAEAEVQPERVDFISPRLDIGHAYLGKVEVVPVVNARGEYISDHHALQAKILFRNLPSAVFKKVINDEGFYSNTHDKQALYDRFLANVDMNLLEEHERHLAISIKQAIEASKAGKAAPHQEALLRKVFS